MGRSPLKLLEPVLKLSEGREQLGAVFAADFHSTEAASE
jgi:hypothetical protein